MAVVMALLSVALGGSPDSAMAGTPAAFTDEAASRGVVYLVGDSASTVPGQSRYGSGVALVDLDNDLDPDIVCLGEMTGAVGIFENDGTGHFTDRTNASGIDRIPDASGLTVVDYDADGDLDLFMSCSLFPNVLYRNDGNLQFTDVTAVSGVGDMGAGQGSGWGDVNGDGWLDLYMGNRTFPWTSPLPSELYINNQDGTFQPVGETLGIGQSGDPTLTVRFFDYDRDGDADFYMGNDHGTGPVLFNHLFRNDGGTFVDVTASSNTQADVDCMGIALGDLDRNGYSDIYVTNTPPGNVLLMNAGDGTFVDATASYGVGSFVTGWGTTFIDYDNDGWLELYINNTTAPNRFYEYSGVGQATDIAPALGLDDPGDSYCLSIGDIDDDGDVDLVVQTDEAPLRVYINNEGTNRNWVKFRIAGRGANTHAVGAQVDVVTGSVTQMHEMTGGSNFKSTNQYIMHFGVDTATSIDQITVSWPGLVTRTLSNYPVNNTWTLWPPERMGDVDGDGDRDADDLNAVSNCIDGPVVGSIQPGCEIIDMDGNGAVDLVDYAAFTQAVN
ncbi:MAG: hypothetical protein DHS20C16_13690 [Phycisphaerae bacterium]|nr:MAG: hypothetical protein DHS20C16_13690 [Phycisphaerae bacterium]